MCKQLLFGSCCLSSGINFCCSFSCMFWLQDYSAFIYPLFVLRLNACSFCQLHPAEFSALAFLKDFPELSAHDRNYLTDICIQDHGILATLTVCIYFYNHCFKKTYYQSGSCPVPQQPALLIPPSLYSTFKKKNLIILSCVQGKNDFSFTGRISVFLLLIPVVKRLRQASAEYSPCMPYCTLQLLFFLQRINLQDQAVKNKITKGDSSLKR